MGERVLSEQMNETPNKYWVVCICLILALATFAVFWQVRHHEFISFDDNIYVFDNSHVKAGLTPKGLVWAFTSSHGSNWHPVTWLSHMLDCQLFGTEPGRHHLINLLLHIINTLLLFAVFRQMTGAVWQSAFVAGAFALHPLHVESVAWVSERKDVLSTLFWLLTMAAYLRYVKHPKVSGYLLMLFVFALGLMAKPMLVTLPFVLLLLDYWPLGRFQDKRAEIRNSQGFRWHLVWEKIPLFGLSVISCIITLLIEGKGVGMSLDSAPLKVRLLNIPIAYLTYLGKMLWPSKLAVFYPHTGDNLAMSESIVAGLLLVGVSIFVIWLAPRHRYLLVGWLWYLGTLVPVIGLVQVGLQARADRYTYVPLTGLFIMIAWGMPELLARWRYRKAVLSLSAAAVLLALGITSWFQAGYWQNDVKLYEHASLVVPNNWWARNNLGIALSSQGKLDKAVGCYRQALQLEPSLAEVHYNLGLALKLQGKLDEAITHFRQALQVAPNDAESHNMLGMTLQQQGKIDEAIGHYKKALEINPDLAKAHNNLGNILFAQGKFEEAAGHYRKALEATPDDTDVHYNLANALKSQGKLNEAVGHYLYVLKVNPNDVEAHDRLGNVFAKLGKFNEAIGHFRQVLRLKPDYVGSLNGLAWILASNPDPKMRDANEAIALAERAAGLTKHQDAAILNTLASAYASAGEYQRAAATARSALDLASAAKDNELAEHLRGQMELYKKQVKH